MIRLSALNKSYRTRAGVQTVLRNVDAVFPSGKSVGILGLNGAGKSTLIRIIGDAEPADSGRVYSEGRISWPLGYSGGFQNTLTARENARFVARIYGESTRYIEEFTYAFSELGDYFDVPLRNYSAGMRSRFAFSVSLACNFDYYLVDEALETGDARYREKFRKAFEELQSKASVILVSHNEQTVRRNCDMAAILHEGNLTMYASVKDAMRSYKLLQTRPAH
ncbi:MAG: ABC transporter ATP-binding protein [Granulosicoccus sp.]